MSSAHGVVAFIGAGQMGLPMVRSLVQDGREVVVFARRTDVRETCTALGAQATATTRAAVQHASAVVVCLYSEGQVLELGLGPDGFLEAMPPGSMLIVHTTGSPQMTNTLAEHGARLDLRVVEAPVSGSSQDIDEGQLTVLLAGDPGDIEAARPVVGAYGNPILAMGPLGSALAIKLLNNALFAAHLQLAAEVERVALTFGVDMTAVASAIQQSSGSSYAMGVVQRFGSVDAVVAAAGHFLAKDVAAVDLVSTELDLDLGVLGDAYRRGPLTFLARAQGETP